MLLQTPHHRLAAHRLLATRRLPSALQKGRHLMLSDTLETFRVTNHRRPGFRARVAQFRQVTGSGDSGSHHDLEVGPTDVDPQAAPFIPAADAAAAAAAAAASGDEESLPAAERLALEVQKRLRVKHLESMMHADSSLGSQHPYSTIADDDLLPLLADAAAHPELLATQRHGMHSPDNQQQQQQQQPAAGAAAGAAAADAVPPEMMSGGIPRSIFVLSMVSMALTSASCVFNTLLPIYMVTELKMTMRTMGMFEGMLEAFSYVVRMFSGVISDRMTSRKAAITAGFVMGAAAKFGMSFAGTTVQLFVAKAVDRLGNGVQAAPRDALIGDLSPAASRSACFGFAQSMRKWGSFMGAGLAFALMKISNNNYQAIFLLAAGVSALSTLAFVTLVPSHPNASSSSRQAGAQQQQQHQRQSPLPQQQSQQPLLPQQQQLLLRLRQQQSQQHLPGAAAAAAASASSPAAAAAGPSLLESVAAFWRDVRSMGVDFYRTLSVIALYGLGHINESLLEARAIEVGFGKAESTLVVALLCFSVFLCAYPLGKLDDKHGHATTFALGMASLVAGDLVLLLSGAWPAAVFVACGFWGVHWAVVQGPMLSAVVGMAPPHLKGTAFGIFYTMMALVAVAANTMFGTIWHAHSANAAFGLSAALITVTMCVMPLLLPESAKRGRPAAAAAAGGGAGGVGGLKPAAA